MTELDFDVAERTVVERLDPLLGKVLDQRFRIELQLAAGGFGAIYRGVDLETNTAVALKVLHPRLASDRNVVARFKREGEVLIALHDPHTVTAYHCGEAPDGTLYIAMELLEGESLHERYRALGAMPWRRVLAIARAVCSSLAEAHAIGVVHRDLKPANIHLDVRGDDVDFVKVLDFGIAKVLRGADLTMAGQMIGTFDYMSPEQMVGGEIAGRSDLYALGVVMYEMIAGQRPFPSSTSPTMLLARMLTSLPAPLADVPRDVADLVMRCLDRDPLGRFGDVTELASAIDRALAGRDGRDLLPAGSAAERRRGSIDDTADDTAVTQRRPAVVMSDQTLIGFAAPLMHPRLLSRPRLVPRLASGTSPIVEPARTDPRIVWAVMLALVAVIVAAIVATS